MRELSPQEKQEREALAVRFSELVVPLLQSVGVAMMGVTLAYSGPGDGMTFVVSTEEGLEKEREAARMVAFSRMLPELTADYYRRVCDGDGVIPMAVKPQQTWGN